MKIVNGINLETGEIVDPEALANGNMGEIEEIDQNPKRDENVKLLSYIWDKKLVTFDSDNTGSLMVQTMNWHANVEVAINLRFDFYKKRLYIFPHKQHHLNIKIDIKNIMDIDRLKEDVKVIQVPNGGVMYRATFAFREKIKTLAYDHVNFLQNRIYKVVMATKVDCHMYNRLDSKVLLEESLIEKVIEKKPTHITTLKDNEKNVYFYQSVLEENTIRDLAKMV